MIMPAHVHGHEGHVAESGPFRRSLRMYAAVTGFLVSGRRPAVHYDAPGAAPAAGDFSDFPTEKAS
jgi:hypothetical protein